MISQKRRHPNLKEEIKAKTIKKKLWIKKAPLSRSRLKLNLPSVMKLKRTPAQMSILSHQRSNLRLETFFVTFISGKYRIKCSAKEKDAL